MNMLLDWVTADGAQKTQRLLAIKSTEQLAVLIDIFDEALMPYEIPLPDLLDAGENGDFRFLKDDPYAPAAVDSKVPEKHLLRMERIWGLIRPIVELPDGGMFDAKRRFQMIQEISAQHRIPLVSLYRYLRRFWKRGQTKNALLPDYKNCGAPGEERALGQTKRGRPHGLTKNDGVERGVNVGPDDKRIIELGMRLFYENSKAPNPPSLRRAYHLLRQKYYSPGFMLNGGVRTPTHAPAHETPTYGQVIYWYRKQKGLARAIKAREGIKRFNLRHRAIGGDAAAGAFGPGSVLQFDSTIPNINLVSELDPNRRIGRPVLYFGIDVFSRMISGFAITLEEESYVAAMLALENVLADLIDFHRREEKPMWWRMFDRADAIPEELRDDPGCIEGIQAIGSTATEKQSLVQTYSFDPSQECKLAAGDRFRMMFTYNLEPLLPSRPRAFGLSMAHQWPS